MVILEFPSTKCSFIENQVSMAFRANTWFAYQKITSGENTQLPIAVETIVAGARVKMEPQSINNMLINHGFSTKKQGHYLTLIWEDTNAQEEPEVTSVATSKIYNNTTLTGISGQRRPEGDIYTNQRPHVKPRQSRKNFSSPVFKTN